MSKNNVKYLSRYHLNPSQDPCVDNAMISIYSDDFNKYKFGTHSLGALRMQICNLKPSHSLKWENQHIITITKPENRDAKSLHKLIELSTNFFFFYLIFEKIKKHSKYKQICYASRKHENMGQLHQFR